MMGWSTGFSARPRDETFFLNGAPLDVGPILREKLFEHERSVILTGATLGYDGKADRFREMVGMDGGKDLFMGSPFDYKRAVLVAVPEDMPEPGRQGYAMTVADAVEDIATKLRDRVLVLFTSNSALESARRSLSSRLEAAGHPVDCPRRRRATPSCNARTRPQQEGRGFGDKQPVGRSRP